MNREIDTTDSVALWDRCRIPPRQFRLAHCDRECKKSSRHAVPARNPSSTERDVRRRARSSIPDSKIDPGVATQNSPPRSRPNRVQRSLPAPLLPHPAHPPCPPQDAQCRIHPPARAHPSCHNHAFPERPLDTLRRQVQVSDDATSTRTQANHVPAVLRGLTPPLPQCASECRWYR